MDVCTDAGSKLSGRSDADSAGVGFGPGVGVHAIRLMITAEMSTKRISEIDAFWMARMKA